MCTSTVWIVDDDDDDQLLIQTAFANVHPPIQVTTLNDGSELLAKLCECVTLPSLILLDINMPRKNGFETLAELRAIPTYAAIPVVMLTTSSQEEERTRSLALGANQFFTKPLSYDKLKALANELSREWNLA